MFGPSTTFSTTAFGQPSTFNYFHGNGDYSTWGSQLNQQRKPHYDDYYRADTQNMYATQQAMQDSNLALKSVEQGMQNLGTYIFLTSSCSNLDRPFFYFSLHFRYRTSEKHIFSKMSVCPLFFCR